MKNVKSGKSVENGLFVYVCSLIYTLKSEKHKQNWHFNEL